VLRERCARNVCAQQQLSKPNFRQPIFEKDTVARALRQNCVCVRTSAAVKKNGEIASPAKPQRL